MQDEILKHTKKIYKTSKDPNHSIMEKVKEIIIEIFIIVFAVSLSIWFHGWSEHQHEQKEVSEFVEDLKVDLNNDIKDLETQNENLKNTARSCAFYGSLTKNKTDSLQNVSADKRPKMNLNPLFKIRNTGNYEGFRSSGKIVLIEDRKLKTEILEYYQKTVPTKDEWQSYYNSLIFKIADQMIEIPNPDQDPDSLYKAIYSSSRAKGILLTCAFQAQSIINLNNKVISSAREIIAETEKKKE